MGLGLAMIGSSLIGGASSLFGNYASAKQAKKQMDFQEKMSNSAYQRAVNDMRKAGLNPVLAAGSPASTPGGAMGQTGNMADAMGKGVNSALAYRSVKANVNKVDAQATSAQTQAALDAEKLRFLNQHPEFKKMYYGGKLSSEAGLSGLPGSLLGLGSSAKDQLQTLVDPEAASAKHYERLNKDARQWRKGFEMERDWLNSHEDQVGWRNGVFGIYKDGKWQKYKGPDSQ